MFGWRRNGGRVPFTATPISGIAGIPRPDAPRSGFRIPAPASLAIPAYRKLSVGSAFLFLARWMDIAIISWLIVQMTDSPFLVALVMVIRLAPISILGPLAGVLADRVDRVLVMRSSRLFMVAVQIGIAITVATGELTLWQLYVVVGIAGIAWTFDMAARRSLTPDLVDGQLLINAIAVEMVIMTGTLMAGPIFVGSLAPYVPTEAFFLISAVLIGVSAIQIGGVGDGIEARSRLAMSFRQSLAEGFAVVRRNPPIAGALLVAAATEGFAFTAIPLVPLIAKNSLNVGPGGLGFLLSAEGIGSIIASLAVAIASRGFSAYGRLMLFGSGVSMLISSGLIASQWFPVTFALLIALGAAGATFFMMQTNLILSLTPRASRGRLVGLQMLVIGMFPVGSLLVGALASWTSPQLAVSIMSTIGLALLLIIGAAFPVLWRGQKTATPVAALPAA